MPPYDYRIKSNSHRNMMQPIEGDYNDWMHRPYDQDMRPAQFFQQLSKRTHDFEKQRDRHFAHEPKRTVPRQKPRAMYKQKASDRREKRSPEQQNSQRRDETDAFEELAS